MCVGGLSKHITSAVTEPGSLGPIPISRCAVAFHPFSLAKGLSDLIIAEPLVTKLPLSAVSSASHKAMEEIKLGEQVLVVVFPTTVQTLVVFIVLGPAGLCVPLGPIGPCIP